jgi:AraC-like DNA-binding protein
MKYHELHPLPPLAPFVRCVWTLEGDADAVGPAMQAVLPDGRPELIVHLGDPFDRIEDAESTVRQPPILFAGQLTSALRLRPTGRIAVAGVRFHADSAAILTTLPQHRLSGLTLDVLEIDRSLGRALAGIRDTARNVRAAADALQHVLVQRARSHSLDRPVRYAVQAIRRRRGEVSIETLASDCGMSRRQLERRFGDRVGLGPKRLARITRFQHAIQVLDESSPLRRGTVTAADCGFADQAHFIRDFRELAGCAPGEHLLRRAELTGFFLDHAITAPLVATPRHDEPSR